MKYLWVIVPVVVISFSIFLLMRKSDRYTEDQGELDELDEAKRAMDNDEIALDEYTNRPLSPAEIGTRYERYIGHLYELDGYDDEGWPHWKQIAIPPQKGSKAQEVLLKTKVIEYIKNVQNS